MKWLFIALLFTTSVCFAAESRSSLSGTVVDSNGQPLADATVMVYHAGVKVGYSTFCPSCYRDCGKRVTTDQKGEFSFQGLAPDLWFTLLAVHEGDVPTISAKLDPKKDSGVKVVLKPRHATSDSSVARGRVTDSAGIPVHDAIVQPVGLIVGQASMYGTVDGLDPLAVTNSQGDFELSYRGSSPAMLVEVEGRGYAPKFAKLLTGESRAHLVVSEGATIRGVLLAAGKPVGNAEVGLIAEERGGYMDKLAILGDPYEEQRVGTASDGSFLISNVPEPVTWLLYGKMSSMPQGEGTPPVEVKTTREGEDLGNVRLIAGSAHVISGKVVLSDGQALPDGMRLILGSNRIWDSQTVNLNRDGSFEVKNVPDGDFCLSPSVRGYKTKHVSNGNCDVALKVTGTDERNVSVTLYPAKPRP